VVWVVQLPRELGGPFVLLRRVFWRAH
jgi:hypothetical protein